jgi:pseudoazurin
MKKLTTLLTLFLMSVPAVAEEHIVKMLNSGKDGMMVFEPSVLSVSKGDTVKFEATDMAHNSASVRSMIPAGAEPWSGKMSEDISVTFDTEGVYVYECTPHKMMAMVGVIKVGSANNIDDVKKESLHYKKTFVMNQDRLDKYLSEL